METNLNHNTEPRIYVACLAAYNNGYLHGAWIDAAQEPWAIYDEVRVMLAASPIAGAEEWAIHDYEGFGGIRIEEYASFDRVSALAAYRSHFHPCGTVEANGGDVVAQITAWLDEEATKPEWRAYVAKSRQGELF